MKNTKNNTKVTILGSGTCVPSLKRSSCSMLAENGQDKVLFDIGPGTMHRMLEVGICIYDISHICISHFHLDHIGELVPFLFSSKYSSPGRKKPLHIISGKGINKLFNNLKNVHGQWLGLPGILEIHEMSITKSDLIQFPNFEIETVPVSHQPESLAYMYSDSFNNRMVYSGDTDYCENLIKISKGVDLFVCESSLPDEMAAPGHLTPSLAGKIAEKAGVFQLVLTHLYPECDTVDIEKQCRKTYKGLLAKAEDLMQFELGIYKS